MKRAITWIRLRPGWLALASFFTCILIIRPFGDVFYGGDDWGYAWSVRNLLETGTLRLSDWVTATAVGQTLTGSLIAAIFGFSLRVLNVSTLIVATIGVWGLYRLGRELDLPPTHAAVAATAVATTPFYLGFAVSFMSDMFYAVMAIFALWQYARGLRRNSPGTLVVGGIFCSLAYLNRQIGLGILIAFVALCFIRWLRYEKGAVRDLFAGATIPVAVAAVAVILPDLFGGRTVAQKLVFGSFSQIVDCFNPSVTAIRLTRTSAYLVSTLLPVTIISLVATRKQLSAIQRRVLAVFLALGGLWLAAAALIAFRGKGFAVRGDLVNVGFVTQHRPDWTILVLAAIVPTTLLLLLALRGFPAHFEPGWLLLIFCFVMHVGATVVFPTFVNNYFLPLLPMFALLLMYPARSEQIPSVLAMLAIAASAAISVVIIESHARYIEASWRWADAAAKSRPLSEVYGEPAWCFWRRYDELMQAMRTTAGTGSDAIWEPRVRLQRGARVIIRRRPEEVAFEFPDGAFAPAESVRYRTLLGERRAIAYRR